MNNIRRTVLACIDGSRFSEAVTDYGAWISSKVGNPLKLLHNIERRRDPGLDLSGSLELGIRESLLEELADLEEKSSRLMMEQGKIMLERALEQAVKAGAHEPVTLQRHGTLADSLIEMEDEIRVLVMGVRGEGHEDHPAGVGGQLETVLRNMHRPVLVVNRPFSEPPGRAMVAYDGSEASRKALDMVATSPLYRGMSCHLVQVVRSGAGSTGLLEQAAEELEQAGLGTEINYMDGQVDSALLEYQQQHKIDLTVMGAFGHSRLRELLFGSVTTKMLCNSEVPLLLLR